MLLQHSIAQAELVEKDHLKSYLIRGRAVGREEPNKSGLARYAIRGPPGEDSTVAACLSLRMRAAVIGISIYK